MPKIINVFLVVLITLPLWAQQDGGFQEFADKPAPVVIRLDPKDSVFVRVESGQKYLIHKVKAGENLYRIKQFYGLEMSDLYYSNPNLEETGLKPNQRLKVPIVGRALQRVKRVGFVDTAYVPVYYRVQKSETLYGIAKRYFGMPVEMLQRRNRLQSTGLSPNQVLHIGWLSREGIPDSLRHYTGLTGVLGEENVKNKYRYDLLKGDKPILQKEGVARWSRDMQLVDRNKLYVLCSQVPAGQVIRLENPMTKRMLYAKVIGKVPKTSDTADALVILTPTVAQALGALDTRFFVHIQFYRE